MQLAVSGRSKRACLALALGLLSLSGPAALPAAAADNCPNAVIRAQQRSTNLPECRAYEIVNRPDDDQGETNRMPWASDDGDSLSYLSLMPGDDALGGALTSMSVARRSASGWKSSPADGRSTNGVAVIAGFSNPRAFSTDMSKAFVDSTLPLAAGDQNGNTDLYRVTVGVGSSSWISSGTADTVNGVVGTATDLSRIVYTTSGSVTAGVYVSDGTTSEQVDKDYPDGFPGDIPGSGAGVENSRGLNDPTFVSAGVSVERRGQHPVSDDGLRVYVSRNRVGANDLFLRDLHTHRTIAVSVSTRAGDARTVYPGQFISAARDGSQAYFVSNQQLTDTPGGGIYRFDLASEAPTLIVPTNPAGAISSNDQSHLYFTSTDALEGNAQPGDLNAYVWTPSGGVRFVTATNPSDPFPFRRVTANGRYALIISTASLRGASNNGHAAAYRYDDTTKDIVCVSCRPDGSPSQGDATVEGESFGVPVSFTRNRGLSADGRVLFLSTDKVVAADRTSVADVYLYQGGTPSLISTGREQGGAYPGDISDDGVNVSFITRAKLVGADGDPGEYDIYDARVDGGFVEQPAQSDGCRGDDCQGTAMPASSSPQPASSRLTGSGNASVAKPAKKLTMTSLTAAQRASLARTGKVTISLRATGSGTVSVRGRVTGSTRTVGSASRSVLKKAATSIKLTFRLNTAARRELSRKHKLSVSIEARLTGYSKVLRSSITLTYRGSR
jgi:hypothetical protein